MTPNKNKTELRHDKIIQMLAAGKVISIAAFCAEFGCSESTIRNDLSTLEDAGKLRRVFGGAVRMEQIPRNHLIGERGKSYLKEKEAIAAYTVAHFITPKAVIILDAGTTTEIIARKLAETAIPLTVLTNYLPIANIFANIPHIRLYLFGGYFDSKSYFFYDSCLSDIIANLRADMLFLGIDGIHLDGFTVIRHDESFLKTALMKIAKKTIAVADHSKFNQSGMHLIDNFTFVKTLVTDAGVNVSGIKKLREAGVDVRVAENNSPFVTA